MTMVAGAAVTASQVLRRIPLNKLGIAFQVLATRGLQGLIAWALIELGLNVADVIMDVDEVSAREVLREEGKRRRRRIFLTKEDRRQVQLVKSILPPALAKKVIAVMMTWCARRR